MVISSLIIYLWSCSKIYLFWISIHFASSNMYPYFCSNPSLFGFLISPFMVVAPHCKALGWIQTTSTFAIENMWVVLSTWITTQFLPSVS